MRVLYLSPWLPYPLDTGSRIRVYHLLQALAQHYDVTLVTLAPHGWAPAQEAVIAPLVQTLKVMHYDPFQRGVLRTALRSLSLRPIVAAPFQDVVQLVRQLHAERPFEVVIAANVTMAAYATALPDVLRILEEHNSHTRWMYDRYRAQTSSLRQLRCWLSWRKSFLYESWLFPQFDLITMVSEQDAVVSRSLLRNHHPPVHVIPNGVDCTTFRPGLAEPQSGTLIFSGSLGYRENYEAMRFFLDRVYPWIHRQHPGAHLRITGSVTGLDLRDLRLDGHSVELTGFVEDIRQEIAAAWVAVVPILSGGGTRIKILEAMALGTPVVATTKGAEGLNVEDGYHILIADQPQDFANQVGRLLTEPDLRHRLITHARRLVEQDYDWGEIGARFVQQVENLAAGQGIGKAS
jgi:glycosyltransferase involved in cell wall biosynthesis